MTVVAGKLRALFVVTLLVSAFLSGSTLVHAGTPEQNLCGGANVNLSGGACSANSASTINNSIAAIVNIISVIVGIVSVIMLMIGGFKYVTSSGDSSAISSAKTTIVFAVVGLVIVAFAQIIVRFVLNKTT